ncbi:hypothetical protein [Psychrobacter sp. I-STPA6b]|uniref:hypothetical protein n=1 Tax=Psychrobacter sp. I-STPA6b TaxID=2585718 RepID=UPI001D0C567B|nr:hypothetical protein [Psychrobacter sp. I-STPA6b]
MKKLYLVIAVLMTGCSTTGTDSTSNLGQLITSSIQSISSSLLTPSSTTQMDNQGWVVAYKVPANAPEYHIDINKPSIRKSGSKVEYKTRVVYLTPDRIENTILRKLEGTSYQFSSGDYIANDVIVDCSTKTYATLNHIFYDKNDNMIMHYPWKDRSQITMQKANSGSIIEHTINSACKNYT